MSYSNITSGGFSTASSIINDNGNTSARGKMQKIGQAKSRQSKYSPSKDLTKWAINTNISGEPNKDFRVVKHKGSQATNKDVLAIGNQAKNGTNITGKSHQSNLHSMYTILSDDNDDGDDNEEGNNDEAIIHLEVDTTIVNSPESGGKLNNEGQKSAANKDVNEENDTALNLRGGNGGNKSTK